jgi:hypothetical protein
VRRVWNQRQLHRVLTEYLRHYNTVRPHRSLGLQPPNPTRALTLVESSTVERPVRRIDVLGGLIHEYQPPAQPTQMHGVRGHGGPAGSHS